MVKYDGESDPRPIPTATTSLLKLRKYFIVMGIRAGDE
jgi:hypothetical protein